MNRASAALPKGDFVHVARLGGYYDLKHYRHCDHLVCVTPDLKAHCVKHGFPEARVHVIPNFVEDHAATPPADRATYGTPAKAPLIFALGRLHENKARSEEHTSELQSLMRISYAVFCLKKKTNTQQVQ